MSIFDDSEKQMARMDNRISSKFYSPYPNSQRGYLSPITYAKYLGVYTEVAESYVDFFIENWRKDNVQETNKQMSQELERVGILGTVACSNGGTITRIWTGLTEEENNPLGEYVLALDVPASIEQMFEFFKRVMSGDLEFRCRYPIGDSNAFDMIKDLGIDLWRE